MAGPKFAAARDGLVDRDTLRVLSGLEFMRGVLDGRFAAAPISHVLNYELHAVDEGYIAFRGTPRFDDMNPLGTVHGGWYGTLLDSALACSVITRLPPGRMQTTLEFKVNLIRAIPPGTLIEAAATCPHAGRSTGVANGTICGVEDGRLYATGSTTCLVMDLP
ncbi:MAG: PaaI family thioesterase [Brevirhabdus sp.]